MTPGKIEVRAFKISKLRRKFVDRIFAIPELQREFVWEPRRICRFLDSLYEGYPVGIGLVWAAKKTVTEQVRSKLQILPPFSRRNSKIWFLIDGQQRMSVLYQVLEGGQTVQINRKTTIDFKNFWFCAIPAQDAIRFSYRKSDPGPPFVRVTDLLKSRSAGLRDFRQKDRARAEACRARILSYRIWLTFAHFNKIRDVRETFIRINSGGMTVTAADSAFARASKFDLRHKVRELQDRFARDGSGFVALADEAILQTLAFAMGAEDVGERATTKLSQQLEENDAYRAQFRRIWPDFVRAFEFARDYLTNFGVVNHGFLPSDYMAGLLALFFLKHGRKNPGGFQAREIRKWFWATAVGARYTGPGYRPNLKADAKFMMRLGKDAGARPRFQFTRTATTDKLRRADYSRRGMLTDAFFCLLRVAKPRSLVDGSFLPEGRLSSRANRYDKHHVFPANLLWRHGFLAEDTNSILNICFMPARVNQIIGYRKPSVYLTDVPKNARIRAQALRSHLLPTSRNSGLWNSRAEQGFRTFRKERMALLKKAFRKQAGDTELFRED